MSAYVLTPLAKADIFDIWTFIAQNSEPAADRVEQSIYDACAFLAEGPMHGHGRQDLTARALRFWTLTRYPNYTIFTGQRRPRFKSLPSFMANGTFSAS